jgi:hypothetical protein
MLIKAILNSIVILSICLPMYVFGQTTFTDVTDQAGVGDTNYSVGIAWGDFNNDGWQDLYVVNLGQGNILYVNNGDGTFDDVTAIAGVGDTGPGVGCAWGDYDNDDLIDLFVSNRPGSSRLYRNQGDTIFIDMATIYSMSYPSGMGESVVWGDYDKDGYIDLYKVRMNQPNILYHNLRGEGFEDVTAFAGVGDAGPGEGATWCDYDDDGFIDLYVINAGGCNLLCHNNGNGTFTDLASYAGIRQPGSSFGCAWGDYDNDGHFDLYVGRHGTCKLYRNNGDGTFEDVSSQAGVDFDGWTLGVAWADYDNDGWRDLHLANHQGDDVLYRNLGNGIFDDVTDQAGVHNYYNSRGNTWGDYNNDGFLDLYVANHDGARNVLFRNNGNNNHYLRLNLTGTTSNKAGIGSKLICVAGELRMTAQVEGGSGFASQNSLPVEFGLGQNTIIDTLYVFWPSGIIDSFSAFQGDRALQIIEGQTVGIASQGNSLLPHNLILLQNYPNPCNAQTTIQYFLPKQSTVSIDIYDILGRKIETLTQGMKPAGKHQAIWDAREKSSGIYFYRIKAGDNVEMKKMVLIK